MKREDFLRTIAVDPAEVARIAREKQQREERSRKAATLQALFESGKIAIPSGSAAFPPSDAALAAAYAAEQLAKMKAMDGDDALDSGRSTSKRPARPLHEPHEELNEPAECDINGVVSKSFCLVAQRNFLAEFHAWMRESAPGARVSDLAMRWLKPYAATAIHVDVDFNGDIEVELDFSEDSATKFYTGGTRWTHAIPRSALE